MSPRALLFSFLTVAGSFLVCWLSWYVLALVLAKLFWPDAFTKLTGPVADEAAIVNDVESFLPQSLFWSATAINGVICAIVGGLLTRGQQPLRQRHLMFLTLLLFVTGLQGVINVATALKWMPLAQMTVQCLSVLFGALLITRMTRSA